MKKLIALITVLITVSIVQFGNAQTVYVNSATGNDATGNGTLGSPYKTFHKGYTMASAGNTINLTGTFTWTDAGETGDAATTGYTINKNLTITGQGVSETIIQAAATENTADRRVFTLGSYTITIQNLTIRYGYITTSAGGAAIRLEGTTVFTLSNCLIERNNIVYNDGDGRYQGGALMIRFWSSTAGVVNIDKCTFQYNSNTGGSSNTGGAIHTDVDNSTNPTTKMLNISNSTFYYNTAKWGSGIRLGSSRTQINNSTFTYNTGGCPVYTYVGGSSYLSYNYLTNITVAYNSLGTGGYGIYEGDYGYGSGTLGTTKGLIMKNCIFAQNKTTGNTQQDYYRSSANSYNNGYNLVETQSSTTFSNGVNGCIVGVQANLRLSNVLAYNSTSNGTQTLALYGGSVAINAGNSSDNGTESIPSTDQRGKSRISNYDMGAFEHNACFWLGSVSTDFNDLNNWYPSSVPSSGADIAIDASASRNCVLDADRTLGSIYSANSTYQFVLNSYTLTLQGDIALSGSAQFDASSGNIVFSGGSYSSMITPSSSSLSITNLNINNSKGIALGGNLTVTNALTLTSGLLTLGSYNLTLGNSATISGTPSATNMVVATSTGELRKTFTSAGSFTFPVGDNTSTAEYSPITLNFTSGTFSSAYAGVTLTNSKFSNNSSITDYLNRYWTVNQSGISSFSCDVTAQYLPADVAGTESYIWGGKYSGSSWTLLNQADVINHRITGTVTGFSTITGGQQSIMPVELSGFNSSVIGRDVKLQWITSKELNNAGFEIQKSVIGSPNSEWFKIGFVNGNGTVNTPTNYSFADTKLSTGKYNYRLKQIDNNGNFKYHILEGFVEIGTPNKFNLSQNYPNPFNPKTKIDFQIPNDAKVTLKIYDISGKEIATLLNGELKKADFYTIEFNGINFSSGVYFYRITTDKFNETKKMLMIK